MGCGSTNISPLFHEAFIYREQRHIFAPIARTLIPRFETVTMTRSQIASFWNHSWGGLTVYEDEDEDKDDRVWRGC